MTHDEIIAVVSAHKAGKRIQRRVHHGVWHDIDGPMWNFAEYEYRVKPEPRTFWAHPENLVSGGVSPPNSGWMLVREVLE